MKKLYVAMLVVAMLICSAIGLSSVAFADSTPVAISTEEQLLAMAVDGNYVLTEDITLSEGKYVKKFYGTLDGNGHTVTINNSVGFIGTLGNVVNDKVEATGTVKNLTVAGIVKGTSGVAGVANTGVGTIENVTVTADISSTTNQRVAGFANATGKNLIKVVNSTFAGKVTLLQGYDKASNYGYWGMFLGYNGGAFGGGTVVNSIAKYTVTIPTSEVSKIANNGIEFFNVNGDKNDSVKNSYTSKVVGENTVYTFNCVVNMDPVTVASVNDEGIMANYGAPVVRFTLKDGTYRYIDGMDKANASFVSTFETEGFDKMYAYKDISYLTMEKVSEQTVTENVEGAKNEVTSTYSVVTINTAEEFESFARIINSAIPAKFIDAKTNKPTELSILNTLAISVKLGNNIDLTKGDANGNASEFYGLGKQEFFPYRGGIYGNNKTLTVDIDAPNGYAVGIISVVSEMAEDIKIEDLTVNGSITGKTKVGIVGYFDMVCNNYINGGNIKFKNVTNNANVTGYMGVGGLLGIVSASEDVIKAYFENCTNNGDITLVENGKYAGGLAGIAGFYQKTGVKVTNCANTGDVTAQSGANYVGGIVGYISDSLSTITGTTSTGSVTADSGKVLGDYVGYTGALKTDVTADNAIGQYVTSSVANVNAIAFKDNEMSSNYNPDRPYSIYLKNSGESYTISPNYKVNLIFTDEDDNRVLFANGTSDERLMNEDGDYYSVILDPGVYTIQIIVRNNPAYYNSGLVEEGTVLGATATYTVNKSTRFNPTFQDVTTSYTGSKVDYLTALEKAGVDKSTYNIPNTSATEGAKWVVTYTQNGKTVEPKKPGTYNVKVTLDATEKFESRYRINTKEFNVTMKIKNVFTVKANDLTINAGETPNYTVTVTGRDGTSFTNIDALGLTYTVNATDLSKAGQYTITVKGKSSIDGADVEYEAGTLTVKEVEKKKGGCKSEMSGAFFGGILFVASALFVVKGKKD